MFNGMQQLGGRAMYLLQYHCSALEQPDGARAIKGKLRHEQHGRTSQNTKENNILNAYRNN